MKRHQLHEVLEFLNSIEGAGYGGMAAFEIARQHVHHAFQEAWEPNSVEDWESRALQAERALAEAVGQRDRYARERDHYRAEKFGPAPALSIPTGQPALNVLWPREPCPNCKGAGRIGITACNVCGATGIKEPFSLAPVLR